jgi:hypothetical protein
MNLKIALVLISIPFLNSPASAQTNPSNATISIGVVTGRVTRVGSQEPISDVQVALSGGPFDPDALRTFLAFMATRGMQASPPSGRVADETFLQSVMDTAAARGVSPLNPEVRAALATFRATNDAWVSVLTDSGGRFTMKGIPPGTYTVRAQKEGYFGIGSNGTTPTVATTPVRVVNEETASLSISMIPGATISGRIRDANGNPQPNVNVDALSLIYQNGFPVLQPVVSKPTDDRGEYRLFWIPLGEYYLSVTPRQSTRTPELPGPSVANMERPLKSYFPGATDVSNSVPIIVRGGERLEGMDITIRTAVPVRVLGSVHSTVPLPDNAISTQASMLLLQANTNIPDDLGITDSGVRTVGTARVSTADGPFEITGLLPGSYDLYARMREPNPDGGSGIVFGHAAVTVDSQDVQNVSIGVYPSVRVNGTVTVNDGGPVPTGMKISLQAEGSAAKIPVYQAIAARAVPVNRQDGSFSIPAVTAAHFRVSVQGLPDTLYLADVRQSSSVYDSGFEVGREPPGPIQVILNSGAARIDGTVRDINSKPLAGSTVILVPPDGSRENRELYHNVISDSNGHFEIRNVAPGSYKLFAWESISPGAYFNSEFIRPIENRGQSISVIQDSIVNAEIFAIPAGFR